MRYVNGGKKYIFQYKREKEPKNAHVFRNPSGEDQTFRAYFNATLHVLLWCSDRISSICTLGLVSMYTLIIYECPFPNVCIIYICYFRISSFMHINNACLGHLSTQLYENVSTGTWTSK